MGEEVVVLEEAELQDNRTDKYEDCSQNQVLQHIEDPSCEEA